MRKILGSSLLVGAAAASVFGAQPAFAATWTVTGGPSFSATGTSILFRDVTNGQALLCNNSAVSGNAPTGTGLPGAGVAHFTSGSFNSCSGPFGNTGPASLRSGASLNAVSYNSTTKVVTATITGITVDFAIHTVLGLCNFTAQGQADNVMYDDLSLKLTITPTATPTMTVTSASASTCTTLVTVGDKIAISGSYDFLTPIKITQP
jgi:hypothetical protein